MENIGINKMMEELKALNPTVKFDMLDDAVCPTIIILGNVPATMLSLPQGYYWSFKNGITNKYNSNSGLYESFEYECDPMFFKATQPAPKKKTIFGYLFG